MNFTNRKFYTSSTSAKYSGVATIAALVGSMFLSNFSVAHAEAPVTAAPKAIHRMVMTPVWTAKDGSTPFVSGIVARGTTKHAQAGKISAQDVIEIPIWPVTPPVQDPTDPTDGSASGDGSGDGSGG